MITDDTNIKPNINFYRLWKSRRGLITYGLFGAIVAFVLFLCVSWKTEYTAMLRIEPELSTTGESTSIEEEMDVVQAWATVSNAVHEMQRTVMVRPATPPVLFRISYYLDSIITSLTGGRLKNYADFQPTLHLEKFIISGDASAYVGEHFYLKSTATNHYTLYSPEGRKLLEGSIGKIEEVSLRTGQTLTIMIDNITPMRSSFDITPVSEDLFTDNMQKSLKVSRKGFRERSGLMEISFSNTDPALAQQFLQVLVKVYLAHAYDRSAMGRINGLAKLKENSVALRQHLQTAEDALAAFKEKNGLENLDQTEIEQYKSLLQMKQDLNTLEAKRKQLDAILTKNHPDVVSVDNQIVFYKRQIKNLQKGLDILSTNQPELNALQNNVAIAKAMLDQNTSTAAQLQATVETITGYARLISMHMANKISPLLRSILAVIFGFLIGMFSYAAYLMINMVPMLARIRSARDFRMVSAMPVVAELRLNHKKSDREEPGEDEDGPGITTHSERKWERLERETQFLAPASANKIMLFTSIDGHKGTAICAERIATISARNLKTLLIDANIMQPALYRQPHRDSVLGFSDILINRGAIRDIVQSTNVRNLFILPAGTKTPNYRLLATQQMKPILSELAASYDRIIIAFPAITPALCQQDILNEVADILFIMVKRGTSVQELRTILPACNIQAHSAAFFILD